jgi:hypothetical protein
MFPCCCDSSSSSSSSSAGDDCETSLVYHLCGEEGDAVVDRYRYKYDAYAGEGCGCIEHIQHVERWAFEFVVGGVTGTCGDINGVFQVFGTGATTTLCTNRWNLFPPVSVCGVSYRIEKVGSHYQLQVISGLTVVVTYAQGSWTPATGGTFNYASDTFGNNWPGTITALPISPPQAWLNSRFGVPGDCIT